MLEDYLVPYENIEAVVFHMSSVFLMLLDYEFSKEFIENFTQKIDLFDQENLKKLLEIFHIYEVQKKYKDKKYDLLCTLYDYYDSYNGAGSVDKKSAFFTTLAGSFLQTLVQNEQEICEMLNDSFFEDAFITDVNIFDGGFRLWSEEFVSIILNHIKPEDFNTVDKNGNTLLHCAINCKNWNLVKGLLQQKNKIVSSFVVANNNGDTPLLLALRIIGENWYQYRIDLLIDLLSYSENVINHANNKGYTALTLLSIGNFETEVQREQFF